MARSADADTFSAGSEIHAEGDIAAGAIEAGVMTDAEKLAAAIIRFMDRIEANALEKEQQRIRRKQRRQEQVQGRTNENTSTTHPITG
jgi:hypothetical protein